MKPRTMIIKDVILNNFKCHENLDFNFSDQPLKIIIGPNGSGKTSIFSALYWALYDTSLEGVSSDDLVNKRVGKNMSVTVTWTDGQNEYKVVSYRKHQKFQNNKFFYINGELVDKKLLTQYLVDKKLFSNCILFSKHITNFTDLSNSGKMEILEELLGFDQYQEMYDKMSERLDSVQEELDGATRQIDFAQYNEKQITQELDSLSNEKKILESRIEQAQSARNKLILVRKDLVQKLSSKSDLNSIIQARGELIQKLQNLSNKIKTDLLELEKTYKNIFNNQVQNLELEYQKKINQLNIEKQNIENEINNEEQKYQALISKLESDLAQGKLELEYSLSELNNEFNLLKNTIEERKQYRNQLIKNIQKLEDEYSNLMKSIKTSICYVCKQVIKSGTIKELENKAIELDQIILHEKDELDTIESQLNELESKFEDAKVKFIQVTESTKQKIQELDLKFQNAVKTINQEKEAKLASLNSRLLELSNIESKLLKEKEAKINSIQNELQQKLDYESQKLIQDAKLEEHTLKQELQNIEQQITEIKTLNDNLQKVEQELAITEANLNELQNQVSNLNKKISEYEQRLDNTKSQLVELQKNLDTLKQTKTILEFWKEAFSNKGIKALVMDEIIPFMNAKSKELTKNLPIIIRYSTQKILKSGEYRNSFTINALHQEKLSGFNELSAGERRLVDIITMLILRELLEKMNNVKINIMLFDELFDSLDDNNVDIVLDMLKSIQNRNIVIISHTLRLRAEDNVFQLA